MSVSNESTAAEQTKKCPYCAETIKAEAIVCRFCGRDLGSGLPGTLAAPNRRVEAPSPAREVDEPKPIIGFIGLLLMMAGGLMLCTNGGRGQGLSWAIALLLLGLLILVYALMTGNIQLFGRRH